MGLIQVTPPALEPLTLAEVRTHLRLDASNVEPAPDAPIAALAGAGAGGVTAGAHRYRVTFVTVDGETDGGTISGVVTVVDAAVNGKVALSGIPVGGAAVTARKLYRTAAAGAVYLLLATLADNTTTTYTDSIADAALGAGAPTSNTTGDPFLSALITAARQYAETFLARSLLTQVWRVTMDTFPFASVRGLGLGLPLASGFPYGGTIRLPRPPLIAVDSVIYVDTAGVSQTLDPATYLVDTSEIVGEINPVYGTVWPVARFQRNAVAVTFHAGYGASAASVPSGIIHALKILVGHWYSHRELFMVKRFALEVPLSVDALLWQHRLLEVA